MIADPWALEPADRFVVGRAAIQEAGKPSVRLASIGSRSCGVATTRMGISDTRIERTPEDCGHLPHQPVKRK